MPLSRRWTRLFLLLPLTACYGSLGGQMLTLSRDGAAPSAGTSAGPCPCMAAGRHTCAKPWAGFLVSRGSCRCEFAGSRLGAMPLPLAGAGQALHSEVRSWNLGWWSRTGFTGSYSSQKLGLQTDVNVRRGPEEQGAAVCISNLWTKLLSVQIRFLFLEWFIFPEIADKYYYRLTLCIPGVERLVPDFPDLSILSLFPKLLQIAVSELFQFRGNRANWETAVN